MGVFTPIPQMPEEPRIERITVEAIVLPCRHIHEVDDHPVGAARTVTCGECGSQTSLKRKSDHFTARVVTPTQGDHT